MVQHIVTPVDGSAESWRGAEVALSLARRARAAVTVLGVEFDPVDCQLARERIEQSLDTHDVSGLDVEIEVRLGAESVAAEVESVVDRMPGAVIVMASHGRGRSAALIGSVAEDVLHRMFGPILLVGPHAEVDDFSGPVVITVDGSDESERAVPLGVAWAIELGLQPWIVHVAEENGIPPGDTFDSAYVGGLARAATRESGHTIEFEELHSDHPAEEVADFAKRRDASLIVASSHGRTGLRRLAMGSVTSGFVRHADCPVLVVREVHSPVAETTASAHGSA